MIEPWQKLSNNIVLGYTLEDIPKQMWVGTEPLY